MATASPAIRARRSGPFVCHRRSAARPAAAASAAREDVPGRRQRTRWATGTGTPSSPGSQAIAAAPAGESSPRGPALPN
eukprot:15432788-Alexandrium_andersonii.AAC.1